MDIQEIQALKHDLRRQLEQISPPRHMQIPGNVETHHLNGAKNLTSKLQQASEKKKKILRYTVDITTLPISRRTH